MTARSLGDGASSRRHGGTWVRDVVFLDPVRGQMRPFGGDHWTPLALFALLFGCLLTVAVSLVGRHDVGRGMWPERRSDARARGSLLSPFSRPEV